MQTDIVRNLPVESSMTNGVTKEYQMWLLYLYYIRPKFFRTALLDKIRNGCNKKVNANILSIEGDYQRFEYKNLIC